MTVVAGVFEAASQFLTGNSILPEPWSGVVIAGLGFLTLVLRTVDKQKNAA
ncbi:MAG: hypothetical protein SFY95_11385 [Planctomycetota bacterium]|nr:hypothetical protein [Planctomycetota bacterium]